MSEVNSAPWMVSVVEPELPACDGLAPVTWSGKVWAESVNGSPLPEPVSPWSRMSYVPAWVSGMTTCWVVWVGAVEDARYVLVFGMVW